MKLKSSQRWTLAFTISAACSPVETAPRAEAPRAAAPGSAAPASETTRPDSPPPGAPEQELALLEREYAYGTGTCDRTAEEVVDIQSRCSERRWVDCLYAGSMYLGGCGVAVDRVQAEALFQQSCGFGSMLGCAWAGDLTRDIERGITLLEAPCARGYLHACGNLAIWLGNRAQNDDLSRAADLLEKACRGDEYSFCDELGILVIKQKDEPRFTPTVALLEHACKAGTRDACHILAIALEDGSLGRVDYARAAALLSSSCDQYDHLPSCDRLGYMLWNGHGVASDAQRGAQYFHKACIRGYGPACDSLGAAIERSPGGAAHPEKALEFYDEGCKLASEQACARAKELRAASAGSVAPPRK